MTYEQAMNVSERLRAHLNGAFSTSERSEIAQLYEAVLAKPFKRTNCQRCFHDALIEVICFLKKEQRMAERGRWSMRAGFIIRTPDFENGKIYTNDNLTDDVAERYMTQYPSKREMFVERKDFAFKAVETPEAVNTTPKARKPRKTKKTTK